MYLPASGSGAQVYLKPETKDVASLRAAAAALLADDTRSFMDEYIDEGHPFRVVEYLAVIAHDTRWTYLRLNQVYNKS